MRTEVAVDLALTTKRRVSRVSEEPQAQVTTHLSILHSSRTSDSLKPRASMLKELGTESETLYSPGCETWKSNAGSHCELLEAAQLGHSQQ